MAGIPPPLAPRFHLSALRRKGYFKNRLKYEGLTAATSYGEAAATPPSPRSGSRSMVQSTMWIMATAKLGRSGRLQGFSPQQKISVLVGAAQYREESLA